MSALPKNRPQMRSCLANGVLLPVAIVTIAAKGNAGNRKKAIV